MKKINKILISITSLSVILISFYKINDLNYGKHIEIKRNFIDHPENLPTKAHAVNTSFGFKNIKADIYRLETIQYIGGNAIGSEYKKYLFQMIDLVTELNPYFEHPYSIGQLLIPSYNSRYEKLDKDEQLKNINQGVELGLKGINNFCDPKKIELIKAENNLQKIWTEEKYANPCKEYNIPYYLAYIYYYYKNDPSSAAQYYKIASAVRDGLTGSRVMAAIMAGKGGDREKSFFMFLNIAKFIDKEDKVCLKFASNLEAIGAEIFISKKIPLTGKILKDIGETRNKIYGEFVEEKENDILSDTKCTNYLNKAIREINLEYVEIANKKFKKEKGFDSIDAKELFEEGFMNYLPVDFQQYEDHGIIYKFNNDIGNYDYEMGY